MFVLFVFWNQFCASKWLLEITAEANIYSKAPYQLLKMYTVSSPIVLIETRIRNGLIYVGLLLWW